MCVSTSISRTAERVCQGGARAPSYPAAFCCTNVARVPGRGSLVPAPPRPRRSRASLVYFELSSLGSRAARRRDGAAPGCQLPAWYRASFGEDSAVGRPSSAASAVVPSWRLGLGVGAAESLCSVVGAGSSWRAM
eukprot:5021929-Prymnesium_polylepis.2